MLLNNDDLFLLLGGYGLNFVYKLTNSLSLPLLLATLNIILNLLEYLFSLLDLVSSWLLLNTFLLLRLPLFLTKSHTVGFHRESRIQRSLGIISLQMSLICRLFVGFGDLLLDFKAAGHLGSNMIVDVPVRFADGLLMKSLISYHPERLLQDSRFFEIADIVLSDALLMAQFF